MDFLLFEEHFNITTVTTYQLSVGIGQGFDLISWLTQQYTYKNTWCGPIAGGSILVIENLKPNTEIKKSVDERTNFTNLALTNSGFSFRVDNFSVLLILTFVLFNFL